MQLALAVGDADGGTAATVAVVATPVIAGVDGTVAPRAPGNEVDPSAASVAFHVTRGPRRDKMATHRRTDAKKKKKKKKKNWGARGV